MIGLDRPILKDIFMFIVSNELKIFRTKYILFIIMILLIQPQLVSAQDNNSKTVKTSDQSQKEKMISIAAEVVRSSKELSQIWPGYWPEDQAFIFKIADEGALLIAPSHGLNSFKPISDQQLPDELHGKAYFHEGKLEGAIKPFILDYDIGDERTALLLNVEDNNRSNIISLLLHEQFHAYQNQAYIDDLDFPSLNPSDIKDRVGFATLAEIERRILIDALSEKNARKRLEILQRYFIIRRRRESTAPQVAIKNEKFFERSEGVAEYATKVGKMIINDTGDQGLRHSLIKYLKNDLLDNETSYNSGLFRGRSYQTGGALTYFLSLYNKSDWQKRIENGEFVDDLLMEYIDTSTHIPIDVIYKKYGYDEIYQRFETIISKINETEIKSVEDFLATKAHRLVIDTKFVSAKKIAGFSAENSFPLGKAILAIFNAIVYNSMFDGYSLTVKEQPMLLDNGKVIILLSSLPKISGTKTYAMGEYYLDTIRIADNGIELKIDIPVLLTITDNVMTIKILETDKKSDEEI